MQHFLHNLNSNDSTTDKQDYAEYSQQKRIYVFSQLCIIAGSAAIIQGVNDWYQGFPFVAIIDLFIAAVLFLGFYFNRIEKHHFSKMFVFVSSNIMLFLFAAVVPQGVGIYMLYFPLVIFYFISFDFEHRAYAFGFTFLSLVLNVILLASNYQLFGAINLQPVDPSASFAINLILSLVLISIGLDYLIKMNHRGENLLLKQQKRLEKLTKEVHDNNVTLEKTNKELDQFVYSTSHDLKAPLASINGLLNLAKMEKEPMPASISTYLSMMRERVNRLNIFIRDILDYSRNSRLVVMSDKVNISQLIKEVYPTINYLENTNKVELKAQSDDSLVVKTDKNRLFRVLINLVSNAIKYSDLDKDKPVVMVKTSVENELLVISVEDNGIGIRTESQDKIFEMFYRGTQLAEGSGLGLYIAREMIHKMGGTLEVKSHLGLGSTFSIRIPLQ